MERDFVLRPKIRFEYLPEEFGGNISERVRCALELAIEIHKPDKRKVSGEPYVYHTIAVASILENWGANEDEIIAGLLHDTLEDHPDLINLELIVELFGERVARLVDGVTKLRSQDTTDEFESLRKVTKQSLIEPGVALIKLADRLHNMLEQEGMKPESQKKNAAETLRFHAPLAESFGLWQIKNTLEDLSFRYVDPVRYNQVRQTIDRDPRLEKDFIDRIKQEISGELISHGIEAKVEFQVGGYWEIMNKQKKLARHANTWTNSFSAITDVISFRILVEDESDLSGCYKAMGIIRMKYGSRIEKRRHDDYLGVSAVNGYSALHDTYKFEEGNVEMAFTTRKREDFNNWGVASLNKDDLLNHPEKYVRKLIFTPKKELEFMKPSDTGIDVAYKLNPLLGLRASAVKIDGEVFGLDKIVPHGGLVEILVNMEQKKPDLRWLNFCNIETRKMIERQLALLERDVEVQRGKEMLIEKVLSERGILSLGDLENLTIDSLLMSLGCWDGLSDLYYKVSYGFDMELIKRKLDEMGIFKGVYTTVLISGENKIGISKDVMSTITKNGGDVRSNSERVDDKNRFVIRVLIKVGYNGKKRIEEDLKSKYAECVVV